MVLEEYKNEVKHLQERVRVAEENSNEAIITGLRQELLDARLQHERMKQSYEDEVNSCEIKILFFSFYCHEDYHEHF